MENFNIVRFCKESVPWLFERQNVDLTVEGSF